MQTIRDGKSIIIEGLHLDPGLYLYEFGKYGISHLHTRNDSMLPGQPAEAAEQHGAVLVEPVNPEPMNPHKDVQRGAQLQPDGRYTVRQMCCTLTTLLAAEAHLVLMATSSSADPMADMLHAGISYYECMDVCVYKGQCLPAECRCLC